MVVLALILFIVTFILGCCLLSYNLRKKFKPGILIFIHAMLGVLSILILAICTIFYNDLKWSLYLFLVAGFGGLYIAIRKILGKRTSWYVGIIHGIVAAFALGIFYLSFHLGLGA